METPTQGKTLPPHMVRVEKSNVAIQLPRPVDARLEYAAYKRDRSKTSIITEALTNWLDANQIPTADALQD